jgi:hypothetical protein
MGGSVRGEGISVLVVAAVAGVMASATPGVASACGAAFHARRIVLGSSTAGIVVLELSWERVDRRPPERPRWRGPVRAGVLALPHGELHDVRELAPADVKDDARSSLPEAITAQIRAGLAAAKAYPGFRPAGMPRHQPCDLQTSCGRVRIDVDAASAAFLVVDGPEPLRVAIPLPDKHINDLGLIATKEQRAASLRLVSLLSYEVAGREVLVVDLGTGDWASSLGEPALWPPCGCKEISRCPPVATTMHHGQQFEVVVGLSSPRPTPATELAATPASAPLEHRQLARAGREPRRAVRTDGIYATDAVCLDDHGWSRRFVRFLSGGVVRQVDGNVTPLQAFRLTASDGHWVVPTGKYRQVGRRVSATIVQDADVTSPPSSRWTLDGIVGERGLRAISAGATGELPAADFTFTQVK